MATILPPPPLGNPVVDEHAVVKWSITTWWLEWFKKIERITNTVPTVETGLFTAGDEKMSAKTADHSGWLLEDGRAVSRVTFAALFGAIGTRFGAGDGLTTFNIPDRRNRSPMGAGSTVAMDATAGALTTPHTHPIPALTIPALSTGSVSPPLDGSLVVDANLDGITATAIENTAYFAHEHGIGAHATDADDTDSDAPSVLHPVFGTNYFIKT